MEIVLKMVEVMQKVLGGRAKGDVGRDKGDEDCALYAGGSEWRAMCYAC